MKALFLGLTLFVTSCSSAPFAPTALPTPVPSITLSYAINIPDAIQAQQLQRQYPTGIRIPPLTAQRFYDWTSRCGAPNVYWGVLAPPEGSYAGLGVVVAPVEVARVETFLAAQWPVTSPDPTTEVSWLGLFTLVSCL